MLPAMAAIGVILVLPLPTSSPSALPPPVPRVPPALELPFSGYWWSLRHSDAPSEPGPNSFSATNAYLDLSGAMHLKLTQDPLGKWGAAEVDSVDLFGYGTYTWTVGTSLTGFDPNVALGLFTRSGTAVDSAREIDIEVARWGRTWEPKGAQFVVQPAGDPGHLVRVDAPAGTNSVLQFVWKKGRVDFMVVDAGRILERWTFKGASVPVEGENRTSMNLWTYGGFPPTDGLTHEVVIKKFTFCPIESTCG